MEQLKMPSGSTYFAPTFSYSYNRPVIINEDSIFIPYNINTIISKCFINKGEICFTSHPYINTKFFINIKKMSGEEMHIEADHIFIGKNAKFDKNLKLQGANIIIEEGWDYQGKLSGKIRYVSSEEFENLINKVEQNAGKYIDEIIHELQKPNFGKNTKWINANDKCENANENIYA